MNNISEIRAAMECGAWFSSEGHYVLFDGQYGSTGKGLLASVIAEAMGDYIDTVATNAAPNSGHTAYLPDGVKVTTQQIPIAAIVAEQFGYNVSAYINAGAAIDLDILANEINTHMPVGLVIHPLAAVIQTADGAGDAHHIASTGKGVGPAFARKISRHEDAVFRTADGPAARFIKNHAVTASMRSYETGRCLVETAQGWSLGINSGFYPYTTSRECSVSMALSDMGVSPKSLRKSIASLRTYPIRVGSTSQGHSGPCYSDQEETTFEAIGQRPELTTVTKRVRRIFTWSWRQFEDMLLANEPDALFINFMNYLPEYEQKPFIDGIAQEYRSVLGLWPEFILGGYGPFNTDVKLEWMR
jgi:adenylosuccinate synthase